jgi:hypothetical protein
MAFVGTALNWAGAITALASGFCWVSSARVKVPWAAMGTLAGPARSIMEKIDNQSRWNAWAALFAGISGFAQSAALLIKTCA